jgi:hypothetical protein
VPFRDFYPEYLSEHRDPTCRRLHFAGSTLVLAAIGTAVVTRNWRWLLAAPLAGYGLAWVGHFFFEHNKTSDVPPPALQPGGRLGHVQGHRDGSDPNLDRHHASWRRIPPKGDLFPSEVTNAQTARARKTKTQNQPRPAYLREKSNVGSA